MGGGRLVGLTTEVGYIIECTSLMHATKIMAIACYSTFNAMHKPAHVAIPSTGLEAEASSVHTCIKNFGI